MSRDNESLTVLLVSKSDDVPDLKISVGESLVIGRNPISQIKNIKCPRELYRIEIELQPETGDWSIRWNNLKNLETGTLKEGESLTGPGFEYQIKLETISCPSISPPTSQQSTAPTLEEKISLMKESCDELQLGPAPTKKLKVSPIEPSPPPTTISTPPKPPAKPEVTGCASSSHWEELGEGSVQVYHYLGGGKPSAKIIAFDFDGTLVNVKSGSKFPKDGNDWKLWDKNLPDLIRKYANGSADSHRFVIFSNQKGVSAGLMPLIDVQQRIESCLAAIGVPCIAFCALRDNIYRKPRPGMWYLLQNCFNNLIEIDRSQSFYVGDAAGRKSAFNKDHSCADILFAINNEIPFATPEQFRAGKNAKKVTVDPSSSLYNLPTFNPKSLKSPKSPFATQIDINGKEFNRFTDCDQLMAKINQEQSHCIIFSGLPGAGKSTFFSQNLSSKGYHRINRDELGMMEKCEKEFKRYVESGVSPAKLVIDNLNVDLIARSSWLSLCKTYKLTPIAFHFNINRDHAIHHNNYRRLLNQMNPESSSQAVPEWLISKYAKTFVPPSSSEGFSSVYRINFSPTFGDRSDREIELYYMYLNEK